MEKPGIRSIQSNDTYFPIQDGVVRIVHNYASEMNRISKAYVVCPRQKEAYDDSSLPYEVMRTASLKLPIMNYALAFPADPAAVRRIVKKGKADIVHVHSPFMIGMTCKRAARIMKVPVVATFHSRYYDDVLQVTKSPVIAGRAADLIARFYNGCDAVWACSEGAKEVLRSYGCRKNITVMPNGCDLKEPENIETLRERAKAVFEITPEKKTLLFTGSMVWQKNLKLILDTFRVLETVRPGGFRLVLAGTGNHEKEIQAYAKMVCGNEKVGSFPGSRSERKAPGKEGSLRSACVLFTGGISDRDLLSGLYSAADLFFFPSLYDTDGLVVKEAAAMKTPSLTVAGSSPADIISPDVNGFTAEEDPKAMAKKIIQITKEKETLIKAGEKAAETIPVPWSVITERVYEEYKTVIYNYRRKM